MNDSTPDTITIPLTQGQSTIIDAIDADLAQFKWYAHFDRRYANGGNYKAERQIPVGKRKQRAVLMHRVILARILGRELLRSDECDHRNLNPLDNRRENLRLATRTQNNVNKGKSSTNTTGLKGVCWHKHNRKWTAQIHINGKLKYLGSFSTAEEAHAAYCEAAEKIHGEFARYE